MSKYFFLLLFFLLTKINCIAQFNQDNLELEERKPAKTPFKQNYMGQVYFHFAVLDVYKKNEFGRGKVQVQRGHYSADSIVKFDQVGFGIASVGYEMRYNIYQFDNNTSLSLGIPFNICFGAVLNSGFEHDGFMYLRLPLILQYNSDYHSTYYTRRKSGFSEGIGLETVITPIFWIDKDKNVTALPGAFVMPVLKIGFYHHNKFFFKDCNTFSITVGYLKGWTAQLTYGTTFNDLESP